MAIDADLDGVIANVGNGVGHWKRMATRLARTLAEPQARSGTGRTERRAAATSGPKYRHDRTVTSELGPHISPTFCCGSRITRYGGAWHPKSFKPLRHSVSYAFSVFPDLRPTTAVLQPPRGERW